MWPFGAKPKRSLVGLTAAASVDVTATIVSPDEVDSPFSDLRAALVWLELSESRSLGSRHEAMGVIGSGADLAHFDGHRVLGSVVLGDELVLRSEEGIDVTLDPRRAHLVFARSAQPWRPWAMAKRSTLPAEVKALLENVERTDLRYREVGLLHGSNVRLCAAVEPITRVSTTPYRINAKPAFAVRDDRGDVTIEELLTGTDAGA